MTSRLYRLQPSNRSRHRGSRILLGSSCAVGKTRLDEQSELINRLAVPSVPSVPSGQDRRDREKFWVEDPLSLFRSLAIIPRPEMTDAQRFNAMTRLILIIAILLFFIPIASWIVFLLCGLILLFLVYSVTRRSRPSHVKIENYRCLARSSDIKEGRKKPKFSLISR